jgi:hypothetical protein
MQPSECSKETSTSAPLSSAALTTGLALTGLLIAIIVLSGTAAGARSLEAVASTVADTWAHSPKPSIGSFALSPTASGYLERHEALFGSSSYAWRTFAPDPVSGDAPVAIFTVTFRNPGPKDLVITEIAYDVADVGQLHSSASVGGSSRARYRYALRHEIGVQHQPVPPVRVIGGATASFELELTSAENEGGLGWLMRIGFVTERDTLFTETFQLCLPTPAATESVAPGTRAGAGR